jgi:hypothetical protein
MPSADEGPRDDEDIDLDRVREDLANMESAIEEQQAVFKRGRELRDTHAIETEVDVHVPPVIADYVRTAVAEGATTDVGKRDLLLYEELLGFELRTTRYHFPDGDVLVAGPDEVVLTHQEETSG